MPRSKVESYSAPSVPGVAVRHAQETTHDGQSKVDRYKWTMVDAPGELHMISKHDIVVDYDYQRDPKGNARVLALASAWSWVACGALVVARREDGSFAAIDGQHRLLAALRRDDVKSLPCVVFREMDLTAEARAFLLLNTNRRPLNGVDRFKAGVVSGEHAASVVSELATLAGRKVGGTSDASSIRCVGILSRHVRENEPVLRRLWPLIVDLCRGNVLAERVVDALMFIEARMPQGESLTDKKWRARILDVGFDELNASMTKFSAAYSRGGAKIWALGVTEALNKGLRNRLSVSGIAPEVRDAAAR